jgi:3-deoxy-D-manno-octulosonate 8-phosphate phosphatase (KDO 8-P phosphatase)
MGDDIVDLALARGAGILACPADAHGELLARADFVSESKGGHGAVRDFCEAILHAQGTWKDALARFDT